MPCRCCGGRRSNAVAGGRVQPWSDPLTVGHVDGLAGDGSLRVGALHIQLQYAPSLRR